MFRILQSVIDTSPSAQIIPGESPSPREQMFGWATFLKFSAAVAIVEAVAMQLNAQSYKLAGVSLVWLPNGLIIATLLRLPRRRWPVFLGLGYLIDFVFNLGAGGTGPTSLAYALFNLLEIVVGSSLLYPHLYKSSDLTERARFRAFLIYGVVLAPLSAAVSASVFLYFHDGVAFSNSVRFWYAADMLGIATVTPLCLSYYNGKKFSSRSRVETVVLFFLLTSVVILIFGFSTFPSLWIVLLALILVGVRAGFTSSSLGLLIVISIGGYLSIIGHGPLGATLHQSLANRTLFFQLFVAVSMVGLYGTEVVMTANRVARSELVESESRYRALADQLELRVQQRTIDLEKEIAEREIVQQHLVNARILAEESNRAKSIFLATMSHELRTPLNAILGYSDLLKDDASDRNDEATISDLNQIRTAGHHLLTIINDVLDLSKIESGRIDLNLENVPVRYVVEDIESIISPLARKQENAFSILIHNPETLVGVDVIKFRQCLLNLLSNACKFTKNGQISLEIVNDAESPGSDGTRWIVKDTGIGIEEKHLKDLFQPFSQVDSSATRRHEGTGLGLVISKRLVSLMRGSISLESQYGVGSSFTIQMPPAQLM